MSRPVQQVSEPVTVEAERRLVSEARSGSQDEQVPGEPAPNVPGPGQTLVGRYTVLGKLGQGGMGVVLAAYDARLDRRVALKLLRPRPASWEDSKERWEVRLVREAQSMARLSHPHVVAVYDAGGLEDGSLYIAMEYVEGQTLREWRLERERTWREVLGAYLEAGRGLAAAHAVGLVHRDFKPDNVLVGKDGRVKVTDFGVARAGGTSTLATPSPVPLPEGTGETWQELLTRPGRVVGTPRYMAPEVLGGQVADVRSDLFSYCVALYEALYKQPAFTGSDETDKLRAQAEGRLNPPPEKTQVPAWVGRVVARGLSADPLQRPQGLEELLATLADDPEARWRARWKAAAMGLTGLALAGLAVGGWVQRQGSGCGGMERQLAGVWDAQVRTRVRQALEGTGLAYAPDTARRLEVLLDDYAGQWVEQSRQVCEAAGGARGQGLRVLQEACLRRRRGQLGALTELLAQGPDKALVPRAVQAATSLPPLSYCLEEKALLAAVPPPEEPALRARVEALQPELDRLKALHDAGKYKEGVARGEKLLEEVLAVDFAPLRARGLYLLGVLQEGAGDYKGAEARMRETIVQAAQGRDSEMQAQAWAILVMLVGERQARPQEALGLELPLQAAVEQFGDAVMRSRALQNLGSVLLSMGRPEQALEHHERALALREKALGPEHLAVASMLNSLGNTMRTLGRYEQAVEYHERGLALREKALGPEHPDVATVLNNLGNVLRNMGRYEQSLRRHERALAIWEKALGPDHPHVLNALNNLGHVLSDLGRDEQALEYHERALARSEKALGPEHLIVASTLNSLGQVLHELGRDEQALRHYTRALALMEKARGPEHPDVANVLNNLGVLLHDLGDYEQVLRHYTRALALMEKARGPEHPDVAISLNNLGNVSRDMGRYEQALRYHTRALAVREKALGPEHEKVAMSTYNLGLVLYSQGSYESALRRFEHARAVWDKALGPEHPHLAWANQHLGRVYVKRREWDKAEHFLDLARAVAEKASRGARKPRLAGALLGLGELRLAQGRPAAAVPLLEQALTLALAGKAEVRFLLAQCLWASGGDKRRAVALATEARTEWQRLGHPSLAQATQWLQSPPAAQTAAAALSP